MYLNTTPETREAKRSYAQVVKDTPSKPPRIESMSPECEPGEDWTDVSSVASCSWPGSVDEEQRALLSHHTLRHHSISVATGTEEHRQLESYSEQPPPTPHEIDEVLCVDDNVDSRTLHAMAGHIKSRNRSSGLYKHVRTIPGMPLIDGDSMKSWRPYPGTVTLKALLHNVTISQDPGIRVLLSGEGR